MQQSNYKKRERRKWSKWRQLMSTMKVAIVHAVVICMCLWRQCEWWQNCQTEVAIVGCCAVHAIVIHTSVWRQCIRFQFDKGCLYTHCCHTRWCHTHIQRQQTEALPSSTLPLSMPLLAISIFFKPLLHCHLLPFLHSTYWGLARLVSDRFPNSGTRLFYSTRNLSKKLINIMEGRTLRLRILASAFSYFLSSHLTSDLWIQKTTCWNFRCLFSRCS